MSSKERLILGLGVLFCVFQIINSWVKVRWGYINDCAGCGGVYHHIIGLGYSSYILPVILVWVRVFLFLLIPWAVTGPFKVFDWVIKIEQLLPMARHASLSTGAISSIIFPNGFTVQEARRGGRVVMKPGEVVEEADEGDVGVMLIDHLS